MHIKDVLLERNLRTVTIRPRLNPKIWESGDLKPEVRSKLLKIANKFKEFVGVDLDVVDVTVTGSNANYTWNKHSDLDLHLIIPGIPGDAERELYSAKKSLWAEQHSITIKGLPVECYVQGQDEPHHSTGVFSVLRNEWIDEPKKVKPNVDDGAIQTKLDDLTRFANTAIANRDIEQARLVKDKITQMRKAGLERAGEWSTENLVFKALRNIGTIDKLSEIIRELEDEELSLETANPQPL
jgi:hypothetical protein